MFIAFADQSKNSFQDITKICNIAKMNLERNGVLSDFSLVKENNFIKLEFLCFNPNTSEEETSLLFLTEINLLGLIDDKKHKEIVLSLSNRDKKYELRNLKEIENKLNDFFNFHININKFLLENTITEEIENYAY
ncbi:hypothetical protein M0R36_11125 [bacterium]|nr:hypothetical protein [bacterium]